jgi:hypothetical protein
MGVTSAFIAALFIGGPILIILIASITYWRCSVAAARKKKALSSPAKYKNADNPPPPAQYQFSPDSKDLESIQEQEDVAKVPAHGDIAFAQAPKNASQPVPTHRDDEWQSHQDEDEDNQHHDDVERYREDAGSNVDYSDYGHGEEEDWHGGREEEASEADYDQPRQPPRQPSPRQQERQRDPAPTRFPAEPYRDDSGAEDKGRQETPPAAPSSGSARRSRECTLYSHTD